ncbi:hypothetical protein KRM28CT15_14930 [Krasilnikovia sp. M28-CT-15]
MTIRVIVADDQPLIRTALQTSVATVEDMEVVGEAGTGADAVRLAERLCPDVVMMDLRMPGMDGIEATRRIAQGSTGARVLVLTTFDDDESVYGALHAGASGFLVKDMAVPEALLHKLEVCGPLHSEPLRSLRLPALPDLEVHRTP